MVPYRFVDRRQAGRELADRLSGYSWSKAPLVLGLPRGGVPVAFEVARKLGAPLDVFLVGKLGFPGQPEYALGAVTAQGTLVVDPDAAGMAGMTREAIDALALDKRRDLGRKETLYRQGTPALGLEGRTLILVDDGAATGASMRAALEALRAFNPAAVVAAVPVASAEGLRAIAREADETVCLHAPESFQSVGEWYGDFRQVSDDEVVACLEAARPLRTAPPGPDLPPDAAPPGREPVRFRCGGDELQADLILPDDPRGLIVFAHGSGSGRKSPRNLKVAEALVGSGFAALLPDLLTPYEMGRDAESDAPLFDAGLLADRLAAAAHSVWDHPRISGLPIGYFGSSTGAAAALTAAVRDPRRVGAIVSRGGRPDLAREPLSALMVPALFIVGSEDRAVLEINRSAMRAIPARKRLYLVPGASHLFEEPGAMQAVIREALPWFERHLLRVEAESGRGA